MEILVSVVITTYKRSLEKLQRAVESVVNQSYKNIEIIVVNDYPEDRKKCSDIQQMLKKYNESLIFYTEPLKNSGACAARNLGISYAKGEYISFLDDDDYWLENKIETQLKGFSYDDIGVVYTPYYIDYRAKRKYVHTIAIDGKVTENLLYRNTMCIFPLMRTSLVRKVGGFDNELLSGQEHDLLLRMSLCCIFKFIDTPTAVYNISDESISMNISKKIKGYELFISKHKELYDKYPKAYHYQLLRMVNNMNTAGEYCYAFNLWLEAVKCHPISGQNITQPLKGLIKKVMGRKAFH